MEWALEDPTKEEEAKRWSTAQRVRLESWSDLKTFLFLIKGCGVIDPRLSTCEVAVVLNEVGLSRSSWNCWTLQVKCSHYPFRFQNARTCNCFTMSQGIMRFVFNFQRRAAMFAKHRVEKSIVKFGSKVWFSPAVHLHFQRDRRLKAKWFYFFIVA